MSVNFGEFISLAEIKAQRLQSCGLVAGEKVILLLPHGIELVAAFVGVMMLGGVPAILPYPTSKVEPNKYASGLAGVSANIKARFVVVDESFPPHLLNFIATECTQVLRGFDGQSISSSGLSVDARIGSSDVAFLQHSSGTTGQQKGVAISHAAILNQLRNVQHSLEITENDCLYSWLPLYHDMGLVGCFLLPLVCHIPLVMQSATDWVVQPATMLKLITQYRCTIAWMPNFAFQFLARREGSADRSKYDLSSLRCLINASEPVRSQSMDAFLQAFGPCGLRPEACQTAYGMAENTLITTFSGLRDGPRKLWVDREMLWRHHCVVPVPPDYPRALCLVSSGRCISHNELRIVSPNGSDLPDGQVGEILVRSDSLFHGYYNRADLTARALQDGWYYSSDIGFRLQEEIYVIGRKDDLMVIEGNNINPTDVEEIVFSHSSIKEGRAVSFDLYNPALGSKEMVVVAEVKEADELQRSSTIAFAVRRAITTELGVPVGAVYIKPPGWIIKSTSGKPGRGPTRCKLLAEHPHELKELIAC